MVLGKLPKGIRAILLRDTGATLSPFNAFLLLQGVETLSLRLSLMVLGFMPWSSSSSGDSNVYGAMQALRTHDRIRLTRVSELLETAPYGGVEQDDFLNGALEIETLPPPAAYRDSPSSICL